MTSLVRAPDVLRQLATDFGVENEFAFLPHRRLILVTAAVPAPPGAPVVTVDGKPYWVTPVLTTCNCYVHVFTTALGCPIPPLKANAQLTWLESAEGKMAGWSSCDAVTAVSRAGLGYPTVAAAYEAPHGHIGVVMPAPATDPTGLYVSAAGIVNRHYCRMVESFAGLTPHAKFFTHN